MSESTVATALPPQLEAVWQRHRAGVLQQVGVLEEATVALMRGRLDTDLREAARREAHKLAGSLGTFGLAAASEQAGALERLLDRREALGPEHVRSASTLVVALRDAVEDTIALAREAAGAPASPLREDAPLLLIVEDDVPLAERLVPEATRQGMRVALATSPDEASAAIARERPDGVLLDLTFEAGTGDAYALLSELTASDPPVPVLVSTMRDTLTDRVEVVRRGGRGFVTKSLPPEGVIDQLRQLVERERAAEMTLLAVDDDPALLDGVRALLEPHEFRVVTLNDPLRFWQELDAIRPDLVLLDVDMPGVTGLELCRVLRNDPRWPASRVSI